MRYRIINDRYLKFIDRNGYVIMIDLDKMFFADHKKYNENKEEKKNEYEQN